MKNPQDSDAWRARGLRGAIAGVLLGGLLPTVTAAQEEPAASIDAPAPAIIRGPYLQLATPHSVTLRFRTSVPCAGRAFVAGPDGIWREVLGAKSATEHSISLEGLLPQTTYRYAVDPNPDVRHAFSTPPTAGTEAPTRIWVIGDSGTGNDDARAVRNAFTAFTGDRLPDLWLMLGDNAYDSGTDAEYQRAVFEGMYEGLLPRIPLWSTFGNHDARSARSSTQTGAYYDIFTLPIHGEAGGEPSGTEAWYAFDHGDIHFICLDSAESARHPGSAMLRWLEADLQSTRAKWIVAFWHHPPYTAGSHDSDLELQLIEMRQYAVPLLEKGGVDLVLTGHSHSYERSHLIRGHFGPSWTLEPDMVADAGGGDAGSDHAYRPDDPHGGAVYAVAGASGKVSGGRLDHPVMYASFNLLGSLVIDVHGDQLDARYLTSIGVVADHFTMMKSDARARRLTHTAIHRRSTWRAHVAMDGDDPPPADWASPHFDDSGWPEREGPVGYGEPYVADAVSGPTQTLWLRRRFDLAHAPDTVECVRLNALFDDGFQVFLNGVEVTRVSLPGGDLTADTRATHSTEASRYRLHRMAGAVALLKPEGNVLSVVVHNSGPTSNDLIFDGEVLYDALGD